MLNLFNLALSTKEYKIACATAPSTVSANSQALLCVANGRIADSQRLLAEFVKIVVTIPLNLFITMRHPLYLLLCPQLYPQFHPHLLLLSLDLRTPYFLMTNS